MGQISHFVSNLINPLTVGKEKLLYISCRCKRILSKKKLKYSSHYGIDLEDFHRNTIFRI